MSSHSPSIGPLLQQIASLRGSDIGASLPPHIDLSTSAAIENADAGVERLGVQLVQYHRSMHVVQDATAGGASILPEEIRGLPSDEATTGIACEAPSRSTSSPAAGPEIPGTFPEALVLAAKWTLMNKRRIRETLRDPSRMEDARRLWRLDSSLQRVLQLCDALLEHLRPAEADRPGTPQSRRFESRGEQGRPRSTTRALDGEPMVDHSHFERGRRGPEDRVAVAHDQAAGHRGRHRASTELGPSVVAHLGGRNPGSSSPATSASGDTGAIGYGTGGAQVHREGALPVTTESRPGAAVAAAVAPAASQQEADGRRKGAGLSISKPSTDRSLDPFSDDSSDGASFSSSSAADGTHGAEADAVAADAARREQIELDEAIAIQAQHDDLAGDSDESEDDGETAGREPWHAVDRSFGYAAGLRVSDLPDDLLLELTMAESIDASVQDATLQQSIMDSYKGMAKGAAGEAGGLSPTGRRLSNDATKLQADMLEAMDGGGDVTLVRSLGDAALKSVIAQQIADIRLPESSVAARSSAAIGLGEYAGRLRANYFAQVMGGISALMEVAMAPFEAALKGVVSAAADSGAGGGAGAHKADDSPHHDDDSRVRVGNDEARAVFLAAKAALDLLAAGDALGYQVVDPTKLAICLLLVHAMSSAGPKAAAALARKRWEGKAASACGAAEEIKGSAHDGTQERRSSLSSIERHAAYSGGGAEAEIPTRSSVTSVIQRLCQSYLPACDSSIAFPVGLHRLSGMFPSGIQAVVTVLGRVYLEIPKVGYSDPGPDTPVAVGAGTKSNVTSRQPHRDGNSWFFSWLFRRSDSRNIASRAGATSGQRPSIHHHARRRKKLRGLRSMLLPLLVQIAAAYPSFPSIASARAVWDSAIASIPEDVRLRHAPDRVPAGHWVYANYSLIDAYRSCCAVLEYLVRYHSMSKYLLVCGIMHVVVSCMHSSYADLQQVGLRLSSYFLSPAAVNCQLRWAQELLAGCSDSAYGDDTIYMELEYYPQRCFPSSFAGLQFAPFDIASYPRGQGEELPHWGRWLALAPPSELTADVSRCVSTEDLRSAAFRIAGLAGVAAGIVAWLSETYVPDAPMQTPHDQTGGEDPDYIAPAETDDLSTLVEEPSASAGHSYLHGSTRSNMSDFGSGQADERSMATFVHSLGSGERKLRQHVTQCGDLHHVVFISGVLLSNSETRAVSLRSGLPEALCALAVEVDHIKAAQRKARYSTPQSTAQGFAAHTFDAAGERAASSPHAEDFSEPDSSESDSDSTENGATARRGAPDGDSLKNLIVGSIAESCHFHSSFLESSDPSDISNDQDATISAQAGVVLNGGVPRLISAIDANHKNGAFTVALLRALACLAHHRPFADVIGDYQGVRVLCRLVERTSQDEKPIMWASAEVFACIAEASLPSRRLLLTRRALACTLRMMRSKKVDVVPKALQVLARLAMLPCASCASSCQVMDWMVGDDDATRLVYGRLHSIWDLPVPENLSDLPSYNVSDPFAGGDAGSDSSHGTSGTPLTQYRYQYEFEKRSRSSSLDLRDALKLEVDTALDMTSSFQRREAQGRASDVINPGTSTEHQLKYQQFEPIYNRYLGLVCAAPTEDGNPQVPSHPLRFWEAATGSLLSAVRQRRFHKPELCLRCGRGTEACADSIVATVASMAEAAASMQTAGQSVRDWEARVLQTESFEPDSSPLAAASGAGESLERSPLHLSLHALVPGVAKSSDWDALAYAISDSAHDIPAASVEPPRARRMSSDSKTVNSQPRDAIKASEFRFDAKEVGRYGLAPLASVSLYWSYLSVESSVYAMYLLASASIVRKVRNYICAGPITRVLQLGSGYSGGEVAYMASRVLRRVGLPNSAAYVSAVTRGSMNAVRLWLKSSTSLARYRRFCTRLLKRTRRAWEDRSTSRKLRWSRMARARGLIPFPKRVGIAASLYSSRLAPSKLASAGLYATVYDAIGQKDSGPATHVGGDDVNLVASTMKLHLIASFAGKVSDRLGQYPPDRNRSSRYRPAGKAGTSDGDEGVLSAFDRIQFGPRTAASAARQVIRSYRSAELADARSSLYRRHSRYDRRSDVLSKLLQAPNEAATSFRTALLSVAASGGSQAEMFRDGDDDREMAREAWDEVGGRDEEEQHRSRLGSYHERGGSLLLDDALDETSSGDEWFDAFEAWWEVEGRELAGEDSDDDYNEGTGRSLEYLTSSSSSENEESDGDAEHTGAFADPVDSPHVQRDRSISGDDVPLGWTIVPSQHDVRDQPRLFTQVGPYYAMDVNYDLLEMSPTVASLDKGYRSDDDVELHGEWGANERHRLHEEYTSYLLCRQYYGPYIPCPAYDSLQTSPDIIDASASEAMVALRYLAGAGANKAPAIDHSVWVRARAILFSGTFGIERNERVLHRVVRLSTLGHLNLLHAGSDTGAPVTVSGSSNIRSRVHSPLSRARAQSTFSPKRSVKRQGVKTRSDSATTYDDGSDETSPRSRGASSPERRQRGKGSTAADRGSVEMFMPDVRHSAVERMLILMPHGFERSIPLADEDIVPGMKADASLGDLTMSLYEYSSQLESSQQYFNLFHLARCIAGYPLGYRTEWHFTVGEDMVRGSAGEQLRDSLWRCSPLVTSLGVCGSNSISRLEEASHHRSPVGQDSGTFQPSHVLTDLPPCVRWIILDGIGRDNIKSTIYSAIPLSWSRGLQYSLALNHDSSYQRMREHLQAIGSTLPFHVVLLRGTVGLSCRRTSADRSFASSVAALLVGQRDQRLTVEVQKGEQQDAAMMRDTGEHYGAGKSPASGYSVPVDGPARSSSHLVETQEEAASLSRSRSRGGSPKRHATSASGVTQMNLDQFLANADASVLQRVRSASGKSMASPRSRTSAGEAESDDQSAESVAYGGSATHRESSSSLLSLPSSRKRSEPAVLQAPGRAADVLALAALPRMVLPPVPYPRHGGHLLSDLSACELGCKDPFDLLFDQWLVPLRSGPGGPEVEQQHDSHRLGGSYREVPLQVYVSYRFGLRFLDLTRCGMGDEMAALILRACSSSDTLISVDLSLNRLGEFAPSTLSALVGADGLLRRSKTLRALHLANNYLSDEFCARLFAALSNHGYTYSNPLQQAASHVTVGGVSLSTAVEAATAYQSALQRPEKSLALRRRERDLSQHKLERTGSKELRIRAYHKLRSDVVRTMSSRLGHTRTRARRSKSRGDAKSVPTYRSWSHDRSLQSPGQSYPAPSPAGSPVGGDMIEQLITVYPPAYALAAAAAWYQSYILPRNDPLDGHATRGKRGRLHLAPVCAPLTVLDLRCNFVGKASEGHRVREPRNIRGRLTAAEHALLYLVSKNRVLRELQLQENHLSSEAGVRLCKTIRSKNRTLWYCRLAANPNVSMRDRKGIASVLRWNRTTWMSAARSICVQPSESPLACLANDSSMVKEAGRGAHISGSPPEDGGDALVDSRARLKTISATSEKDTGSATSRPPSADSSSAAALGNGLSPSTSEKYPRIDSDGDMWDVGDTLDGFYGPHEAGATPSKRLVSWGEVEEQDKQISLHEAAAGGDPAVPASRSESSPEAYSRRRIARFMSPRLVSVLFAMPLRTIVKTRGTTEFRPIVRFDVEEERKSIYGACRSTHRSARIATQFSFCSEHAFEYVLRQGARVLVLSGHASREYVYFEGPLGGATLLNESQFLRILNNVKSQSRGRLNVDMVVVSMCHSRFIGDAFVKAGVRHVVCIEQASAVKSQSVVRFTARLLMLLTECHTVRQAFYQAVDHVQSDPALVQSEGYRQASKFLLLPESRPAAIGLGDGWGATRVTAMSRRGYDYSSGSDEGGVVAGVETRRAGATAAGGGGGGTACGDSIEDPHERQLFGTASKSTVDVLDTLASIRKKRLMTGVPASKLPTSLGWLTSSVSSEKLPLRLLPRETETVSLEDLEEAMDLGSKRMHLERYGVPFDGHARRNIPIPAGVLEDGGASFDPLVGALPRLPSHVVGRELDVRGLVKTACYDGFGLLSVCGERKIGKSTAAILAARYIAERGGADKFPDGIYYVNMRRWSGSSLGMALCETFLGHSKSREAYNRGRGMQLRDGVVGFSKQGSPVSKLLYKAHASDFTSQHSASESENLPEGTLGRVSQTIGYSGRPHRERSARAVGRSRALTDGANPLALGEGDVAALLFDAPSRPTSLHPSSSGCLGRETVTVEDGYVEDQEPDDDDIAKTAKMQERLRTKSKGGIVSSKSRSRLQAAGATGISDYVTIACEFLKTRKCLILLDDCDDRDPTEIVGFMRYLQYMSVWSVLLMVTSCTPVVSSAKYIALSTERSGFGDKMHSVAPMILAPGSSAGRSSESFIEGYDGDERHIRREGGAAAGGPSPAVNPVRGGRDTASAEPLGWWPDERTFVISPMKHVELKRLARRVLGRDGQISLQDFTRPVSGGPAHTDHGFSDTLNHIVRASRGLPFSVILEARKLRQDCIKVASEQQRSFSSHSSAEPGFGRPSDSHASHRSDLATQMRMYVVAAAAVKTRSREARNRNPELGADGAQLGKESGQGAPGWSPTPWTNPQPPSTDREFPDDGHYWIDLY